MNWFRKFMSNRYGVDELSNFMVIISIVIFIIYKITNISLLNWISLLTIGFAYYRVFSKNYKDRYSENQKFLNYINRFKERFKNRRIFKYFKCPVCNQRVRVPKGKGKIKITCPKCKNKMIRRT